MTTKRKKPATTPGLAAPTSTAVTMRLLALVNALGSLRAAWRNADDWSRRFIVDAMKNIFATPEVQRSREWVVNELRAGLSVHERTTLFEQLFPSAKWKKPKGGP